MPMARHWMLRGALLLGAVSLCGAFTAQRSAAAPASEGVRIPSIKQVAVMPVYWQGAFPEGHAFDRLKKHLEESFAPTARASDRFAFTNDVITADLWASPEGRRELLDEYEIDAFLNLTVTAQSDLMQWTVRLLSPDLKNYLSESERVPYAWFLAASPADIDRRLQDLLFRTLNRYPIDVFVTSVQGRYLTLSSGKTQNIFDEDELSFYETSVKSLHPVDGSWLSFNQRLLGKAKVIESKGQSAVAEITSLSFENAIKVGDGARVANIATRRNFQKAEQEQQRYVPIAKDSAIVEAAGESQAPLEKTNPAAAIPVPPAPPRIASTASPAADPPAPRELGHGVDSAARAAPVDPDESAPHVAEEGAEAASLKDLIPIDFKAVRLAIISENIGFSGAGTLSSVSPDYLINALNLVGMQDISSGWEAWYTGGLRIGETKKGRYTGFSGQIEGLRAIDSLSTRIPSLNRILVGGLLRLETIGVTGEKFGGWDGAFIAPTVHFLGSQHIAEIVQTIDYDLQSTYFLKASGSAGIGGKKRDIDGGSGLELQATALFRGKPEEFEWGGFLLLEKGSWDLSKGSLDRRNVAFGLACGSRL